MTCHYCRALNSDDEHRCCRCGRRLAGSPGDGSPDGPPMNRVAGALAAAPAPARQPVPPPVRQPVAQRVLSTSEPPAQRDLFASARAPHKVIPFESIPGSRVEPLPPRVQEMKLPSTPPRRAASPKVPDTQQALDFLPPATKVARKLKTTVEAVIYCDAPVATKMHRGVAAALDLSMILIAYGLFLLTFHLSGGEIAPTRLSAIVFGVVFGLITLFYGLLWVLVNGDTAGKRWTRLRLTNFDGFPPDPGQRVMRFAGQYPPPAARGRSLGPGG